MNLKRLKWIAVLAPIGFIGVLEYSRYALAPVFASLQGRLLITGVVAVGAIFFYGAIFTLIAYIEKSLERKNRELSALYSTGLDLTSVLAPEELLQRVVDLARNLLSTRYGALAIYNEDGSIQNFVTSGIDNTEAASIGSLPVGRGLLGFVLREGQCLRVPQVSADSRSCGFPENHPPMNSLLAVPLSCHSPIRGNLYVSEKVDDTDFTEEDQQVLMRLASQTGIAMDNSYLHSQVKGLAVAEERLRLGRELHDVQAQILAYVNTKTQAIEGLLAGGRVEEAQQHLQSLSTAAREAYADVREGILGMRTPVDGEGGLGKAIEAFIEVWEDQAGLKVNGEIGEIPELGNEVELQLIRILQEALANVRKHARATRVKVEASFLQERLLLRVEDDGVGFDSPSPVARSRPRFGLATMKERAEAIGATLEIRSQPGGGTRVELEWSPK
ncbi:MAG: GAF domain-containing sensor histidine kinase [Deltaproteobacteria bacterium]|nr:GAF domain-containing sensor histidine kinase [Deltaproteobacteria bacterium]